MAKRRRKTPTQTPSKRQKTEPRKTSTSYPRSIELVKHPVLSQYYPRVVILRQYLVDQLPATSKKRRRRILHYGKDITSQTPEKEIDISSVTELLDNTVIGQPGHVTRERNSKSYHLNEIQAFTQQLSGSTAGIDLGTAEFMQSEVVDFAIWLLFRRNPSDPKPSHLLCNGFQRSHAQGQENSHLRMAPGIPGILYNSRNSHAETMKNAAWSSILQLLGKGGQKVMTDLLLDCGIFIPIDVISGYFYQLCGAPVIELKSIGKIEQKTGEVTTQLVRSASQKSPTNKPTGIKFIRSRMMYAKASLNSSGEVRFGLQRIHILNRLTDLSEREQLVHAMKYIFPRQFDLHNVFTSQVDPKDTALKLKDYTLREKEISRKYTGESPEAIQSLKKAIPKRLRGPSAELIKQLHKLHRSCAYREVLRYYCPVERDIHSTPHNRPIGPESPRNAKKVGARESEDVQEATTLVKQTTFTDLASPVAQVSAFCRAIITKVIPYRFWGDGDAQRHNYNTIMRYVDYFTRLRRYESLSLHQVVQELKLQDMGWLRPPNLARNDKMSASDAAKRKEILHEFVYYLFDSLLIPLIRSNFHVTESNVHKQRIFYFHHDVWRMLAEPSLSLMKMTMFEEIKGEAASKILASRYLGYSYVRLLPKKIGARPIMNLKRRMQMNKNGKIMLGRSINATLTSAFSVLNYEKTLNPEKLGSSLFSVGDMFPRLQAFKSKLIEKGLWGKPLYFCKVDVVSCFDTIPQQRLVQIVEDLISAEQYDIRRQVEIQPGGNLRYLTGPKDSPALVTVFKSLAGSIRHQQSIEQRLHQASELVKAQTILIDLSVQHQERKRRVVTLLREHIQKNLVKIGRKFYRQKNGIPQGSIVSTLLCSLFYAELEQDYLSFTSDCDSMLMRLLDDFLLVTTDRIKAERFLQIMHDGKEEYGVQVKTEKSLVNFNAEINGNRLVKIAPDGQFLYCGILIDTFTLEVQKNPEQQAGLAARDALTVDLSKIPGQTFHRKTLNGFKIQMQVMFLDASHNSRWRVLSNLYYGFRMSAERCWEYLKCLGAGRKAASRLLIKTVQDLITLGYLKVRNANRSSRARLICRRQVQWVGCTAFNVAFQRRQTHYNGFLQWIKAQMALTRPEALTERRLLERAVERAASAPRISKTHMR